MEHYSFTKREKELIPYIVGLHQNKFIAQIFNISDHCVKFHVTNILRKTGCKNKRQFREMFKEYMDKTMV